MYQMKQTKNREHVRYLDNMRALATLAVVVAHVSAQNWYEIDISSLAWSTLNFYDSAMRWAVPVFVMISGTVFLGNSISVKQLFTKYIPRLIVAFGFWSFVYALLEGGGAKLVLARLISGKYHMWYIPMIIGVYLCIPIYTQIVKNDNLCRYFLGISIITAFLCPYAVSLIKDFGPKAMNTLIILIEPHLEKFTMSMMLGYSVYFVLGYYLHKAEIPPKQRAVIYILGFVSYCVTVFTTYYASQKAGEARIQYYDEFTLCTLLQAVAVFVFFKYHGSNKPVLNQLCGPISRASFGIYWVHIMVMELLNEKMMINTLSFLPILSVPVISIVVFSVSFAISWGIGKIPLLKRYLV